MDPLAILPAELWELIFQNVDDSQDWLNLYRASPTFEGLVGDQRRTALLSHVLPQVYKYRDEGLRGLLPLRLVSRGWKGAVDRILDSKEGPRLFVNGGKRETYNFRDSARISSFMDKFGTHYPGNPFVGSFVLISFDPRGKSEEMMTEFKTMVAQLLTTFGTHIKRLKFTSVADTVLDTILVRLRSVVELTPNLEELNVASLTDGDAHHYHRAANPNLVPIPINSRLTSFSFYTNGPSSELTDLQDIIIRMCCNPDTLRTARIVVGVPPVLASFPVLEKVRLRIIPSEERVSNIAIARYSCPLSDLTLWETTGFISLNSVVEHANRFQQTLTSLTIDCRWEARQEDYLPLRLDLPNLKYMTTTFLSKVSPFNLLENLSNLEELCLCQSSLRYPTSNNTRVLKWFTRDFEAEMSKFRIWDKLPKLRKIRLTGGFVQDEEVRVKIYSRGNNN